MQAPLDQLFQQAMERGFCEIPSPELARALGRMASELDRRVFVVSRATPVEEKGSQTFLNALAKAQAEQRSSKGTWYRLLEESP